MLQQCYSRVETHYGELFGALILPFSYVPCTLLCGPNVSYLTYANATCFANMLETFRDLRHFNRWLDNLTVCCVPFYSFECFFNVFYLISYHLPIVYIRVCLLIKSLC